MYKYRYEAVRVGCTDVLNKDRKKTTPWFLGYFRSPAAWLFVPQSKATTNKNDATGWYQPLATRQHKVLQASCF